MGSNSVYRLLQELFPQVDSRVLKAVSLEHSNDADVAAETVLAEIIPFLPSSSNSQSSPGSNDDGGKTGQVESTMYQVSSIDGSLLGETEAIDAGFSAQLKSHTVVEPENLEPAAMSFDHNANSETEANGENVSLDGHGQVSLDIGGENVDNKPLIAQDSNPGIFETSLAATPESDPSSKTLEKADFALKFVDSEDESTMSSVFTRSVQICNTEYLDVVLEDAKNNKKALVLAMESVIDLMKAVEAKEKDAEQAKENARRGCSDILAKVDEVKHALLRAKEANDMHAGEVNAEKAILGTELRELQHRLFTLSDDKNKSLEILDEMRRALEIRMAAALEEIAAAENEKFERERSAREALSYQETEMEKVVEQSKKLQLEAEENSKLQEFLMDRGRVIDILQGEMAVKCQDVLLLKEKFDKRIPLSQSLFSSQTSSIIGSSSSSFRSTTTPYEPETETHETPKKSLDFGDSYGILDKSSSSDASPVETVNGEEKKVDEFGLLGDDGWELFDSAGMLIR